MRQAAIAILHYLRDHPLAKDSAKGIAQWWVGEAREVVEKALKLLVNEGVLIKRRHLYQLAPGKSPEYEIGLIEETLRQMHGKKNDAE